MVELTERNAAFAAMGLGIFATAVAFMNLSSFGGIVGMVLVLLGALGIVVTYAMFTLGFAALPLITNALHVSEHLGNGYKIPPSQDVIVRNVGGIYHATMYMQARFYEAATSEVEEETTSTYMELWERALAGIKFPFKFCLISFPEDIAKYREDIETQRYAATIKLGKEREKPNPDALVIDKWEREIARLNAMLARLTAGEKPMGAVMYLATTGIGVNEEAAIAAARRQVGEIRSTVANALNIEIKPVKGEDMKRCFRWEYYVPPDKAEFVSSL
jgi:hypothetical protein